MRPVRSYVRTAGVVMVALAAATAIFSSGCDFEKTRVLERPGGTMEDVPVKISATAVQGTVGSVAYPESGIRLMRVRGYGLVTGLVDKGSRRCPEGVRAYLIDCIRRTRYSDPYRVKTGDEPSAAEMIDSPDTAVVMVEGEIPAGAVKGRRFDVRVVAVDEETTSLVGGVLLQTELKVFQSVSPVKVIEGKTLARAGGPIFINPFRQAGETAGINQREGHIIAGGAAAETRKLSLAATIESYSTVRQVQDAINMRFKSDPPVAKADTPRAITLVVPPEYRGREGRFLELALYLPLSESATEIQSRSKLLAAELSQPDAPHGQISLALEGIGKPAIEFIRPLYAHADRQVNFAAAATGLHLGDPAAIEIIIRHAKDARSPLRYQAIRELGQCGMPRQAAPALYELLDGEDTQVRILAYEALRLVDRRSMLQVVVGDNPENFLLEVLPSKGRPLIYARRTKAPRIALIGGDQLFCKPPLLYTEVDAPVTITAKDGDKMLAIFRRDPAGTLGPYYSPLAVPTLTRFLGDSLRTDSEGKLQGLGLDYGAVVAILYHLCERGAIPADLRWEEPDVDRLLGPLEPMGRPESEL